MASSSVLPPCAPVGRQSTTARPATAGLRVGLAWTTATVAARSGMRPAFAQRSPRGVCVCASPGPINIKPTGAAAPPPSLRKRVDEVGGGGEDEIRITLSAKDCKQSVMVGRVEDARGKGTVVIEGVLPNSIAWEAGIRPGQAILEVNDPVRQDEMWVVDETSSVRFIRDAIRLRNTSCNLVVEREARFAEAEIANGGGGSSLGKGSAKQRFFEQQEAEAAAAAEPPRGPAPAAEPAPGSGGADDAVLSGVPDLSGQTTRIDDDGMGVDAAGGLSGPGLVLAVALPAAIILAVVSQGL